MMDGALMATELLGKVKGELMPTLPWPAVVLDHGESPEHFGNANVTLQVGPLRLAISRDRLQIFVDFGPIADRSVSFDEQVVMEYLGLSAHASFPSEDVSASMQALSQFLRTFWDELIDMFSASKLQQTKNTLSRLREKRAERLFGPLGQ
jgi:hypothetical protein